MLRDGIRASREASVPPEIIRSAQGALPGRATGSMPAKGQPPLPPENVRPIVEPIVEPKEASVHVA